MPRAVQKWKSLVSVFRSRWRRLTLKQRELFLLFALLSFSVSLIVLGSLSFVDVWFSVLWALVVMFITEMLKKRSRQDSANTVADYLDKHFPEQWEEAEHIFRDLADSQQWELRKGHSQLAVKLRYRKNFIFTWLTFLMLIAFSSIKKAFYRLS